jgi:nicotinamidase-related amidase
VTRNSEEAIPRPALLVMDYQVGVLARFPNASAALAATVEAVSRCRELRVPVIWVRVAFRPGFPEISSRNMMFSALSASGGLLEGSAETEIHPDLRPRDGEVVVTKRRVSAFSGGDLSQLLAADRIDTLILAGVATSGVVLSTAREAADRDYRLIVLSDCCADGDDDVHHILMYKVLTSQAAVIRSSELPSFIQGLNGS